MKEAIVIRECTTVAEFDACIQLQKEAFELPDLEISPRRHFIVSRQAGGWTLGAFETASPRGAREERMVGFVHHLAAVRNDNEIVGYSHMMAVAVDYQNKGVGARLKWAQRERALAEGRTYIRWTWEPMRARNAYFNLNRLGVTVESYADNFYGTYYGVDPAERADVPALESDRVIASWYLDADRVTQLAGGTATEKGTSPSASIVIPANWAQLLASDPEAARQEQFRVREEFKGALGAGLICAGFDRNTARPCYLFYERDQI